MNVAAVVEDFVKKTPEGFTACIKCNYKAQGEKRAQYVITSCVALEDNCVVFTCSATITGSPIKIIQHSSKLDFSLFYAAPLGRPSHRKSVLNPGIDA